MTLTLGERTDNDGVRRAQRHPEDHRPVRTTSPQEGLPACGARPDPVEGRGGSWGWGTPIGGGGNPTAQAPCAGRPGPRRTLPTQPRKGRRDDSETRVHPAGRLRPTSRRDWVTQARGLARKGRRPEVVT